MVNVEKVKVRQNMTVRRELNGSSTLTIHLCLKWNYCEHFFVFNHVENVWFTTLFFHFREQENLVLTFAIEAGVEEKRAWNFRPPIKCEAKVYLYNTYNFKGNESIRRLSFQKIRFPKGSTIVGHWIWITKALSRFKE